MYFPYLRGRQFELLALQELIKANLISPLVIPVIEPVKLSPTLINTITEFQKCEHRLSIIDNPAVGSFLQELNSVKEGSREEAYKDRFLGLLTDQCIVRSMLLNAASQKTFESWENDSLDYEKSLIVCDDPDQVHLFSVFFPNFSPAFTLIPDESTFRRRVRDNKVILSDAFEKKARNVDYKLNDDEFFTENHLFYKSENYIGFADYSVIGKDYQEAGFAPYAVAIHIVYFTEDKSLRIKHFVSKTNDDTNNPALKFYEAISQLAEWYYSNSKDIYLTRGLAGFLKHYKDETYPGLGTVKKLSVMHHIELISHYLNGAI